MKKKAMTAKNPEPEWSHKIQADDIGTTPLRTTISASPQQRKDLARRLRVDSVDSFEAKLVIQRDPRTLVLHVSGTLHAKVTQACVVTLEPVSEELSGPVEGWYAAPDRVVSIVKARHERNMRGKDTELPMLDEKDDPEPIIDGEIDLGELVTQYLSLAINPYPHKEGVEFERDDAEKAGIPPVRRNPFAALKKLRKPENQEN